MVKAIALGAAACGIAGPFLRAANRSAAAVNELIAVIVDQLRVAMFAAGAADIDALQHTPIHKEG
jgi:isopentenyl-diphosphate delta-isomerase